ncbi:hypothetical protein TUM4433_23540 [Shewanella schlegeliana]|nr:hypothetical protein TUM4433_23540 [Shewanella schlegeliana]
MIIDLYLDNHRHVLKVLLSEFNEAAKPLSVKSIVSLLLGFEAMDPVGDNKCDCNPKTAN